ncbi:MAG: regulator of protease activity HflC (stomatin/prohibitin superfamily) [Planctomycetota bacterium]|jgi:regulator of protease activity HflC (stomatin/prohibitin superfamily)
MKVSKIFMGLIALAVLSLLVMTLAFERISPSEIGVKQYLWGEGGYVEEDFDVGFHLGLTGFHKWHHLDARTHFLTFSDIAAQGGNLRDFANSQIEGPLEIRTRDNHQVSVDVTVTYAIIPGEAHLLVAEGLKSRYRDLVTGFVKDELRNELARLNTESFYDTAQRLELISSILPRLVESMGEFHVKPETILIRAVRFSTQYEDELQSKQLSQQNTEVAKAERRVQDASKITDKLLKETEAMEKAARAEWDKKLQDATSTNQVDVATILAAANIYDNQVRPTADANFETLIAEGMLALDKAQALRDELRNAALDSKGGRILQARDAAENLQFESVTLNSNDPNVPSIIEIDKLVDLLIGED